MEQHGPHLPLFMDAEHGERLALEVARRLGDALVPPSIRVGCSKHRMGFAGTVSLRIETFEAICTDYCVSLARHGFRRIYFIPSHGGNYGPLAAMLGQLNRAVGPGGVHGPEVLKRLFEGGIGAVTPNGILGDARGMSAAIGRRCIAETADLLVSYFRAHAS